MSDLTSGGEYEHDRKLDPSTEPRQGLISSSSAPGGNRASAVWADSGGTDDAPTAADAGPAATPTVELTATESRVLGSLIEKSYLTPDVYPMTTNSLVSASNQKTNRDPVVDYSAVLIDSALMELRQRNLVRRVHSPGARSTKHRQTLDEVLSLSAREVVLISVLLLRGPQTIGELRLRTERHDVGFDDLDAVESCLVAMAARPTPLVVQLARQPGHKENRWRHLLSAPGVDDHGAADENTVDHPVADERRAVAVPPAKANDSAVVIRIDELENQVATLQRQLADLATKLGEPLN